MKLNISNFAKIDNADIIIDGITVIAGENNTGKSTIGKILFSIFNSLYDINEQIQGQRISEINANNRKIIQNHINVQMDFKTYRQYTLYVERYVNNIIFNNETFNKDEIAAELNDVIRKEIISRYFNSVFNRQINSLSSDRDINLADIDLQIKDKHNKLSFSNNECNDFLGEINILHKAVYIDNPFIIDELSKYQDLNIINETLKALLLNKKNDIFDGVIGAVMAKEKINDIMILLRKVVDGDITNDQMTGEFYLQLNGYNEPVALSNLSTGMKSFVILKMLLEKGSLSEKDVVILDEPEIHLHPQWQIAYAELLVLLQKQFDLSVVVTTHSPYFVDAINLFSCKYATDSSVNYYISSVDNNRVNMKNVTDNIEEIYKKMVSPIEALDTLRYELNNG
uniref:AAA family ATPase n=1 Tax=[Lactobacillus] rogosae TaxID=706562 RepID=UPI003FED3EDF